MGFTKPCEAETIITPVLRVRRLSRLSLEEGMYGWGSSDWPVFRLWTPPVALLAGPCSGSQARVQAVDTPCGATHRPVFRLWTPAPCSTSLRDSLVAAMV